MPVAYFYLWTGGFKRGYFRGSLVLGALTSRIFYLERFGPAAIKSKMEYWYANYEMLSSIHLHPLIHLLV